MSRAADRRTIARATVGADAIRRWMRAHAEDHRDARTGEIDCTGLVEAWDRACADGAATMDSDHPAWEIAVEVAS